MSGVVPVHARGVVVAAARTIVALAWCITSLAFAGDDRPRKTLDIEVERITSAERLWAARLDAFDEARRRASAVLGQVVLTRSDLVNEELTETSRVITAGVVKLDLVSEQVVARQDGRQDARFSIRASLDEAELEEQLRGLRGDLRAWDERRRLMRENEVLQAKLAAARAQIASADQVALTEAAKAEVLASVGTRDEGRTVRSDAIEQGRLNRLAQANERESAWRDRVERVLFQRLLDTSPTVRLVESKETGNAIQLALAVGWNVDQVALKRQLMDVVPGWRYREGRLMSEGICLDLSGLDEGRRSWIESQQVEFEVTVGQKKSTLVVAGKSIEGYCVIGPGSLKEAPVVMSLDPGVAFAARNIDIQARRIVSQKQ